MPLSGHPRNLQLQAEEDASEWAKGGQLGPRAGRIGGIWVEKAILGEGIRETSSERQD